MSNIRPQQLTDRELLDYAHLTGYDKLSPEWVQELAKRFEHLLNNPPENDDYQNGYDEGYDAGYAQGAQDAEDDLK